MFTLIALYSLKSRHLEVSRFLCLAAIGLLTACSKGSAVNAPTGTEAELFSKGEDNFRLSLTDAPNHDIKSVFVNVRHAEVFLAREGREGRVLVAKNLGLIDLLTLQNGVTLPLSDLKIPEGTQVKQIRLILEPTGNYLIHGENERCDLQTPSQQKTGIKLLVKQDVVVQEGYKYSIVVDFDAKKSIVMQGNGGCLLKPVLKVKSIARLDIDDEDGDGQDDDGTTEGDDVDCIGGESCGNEDTSSGDGSNTGSGDGTSTDGSDDGTWDESDESTLPDVYDNPNL